MAVEDRAAARMDESVRLRDDLVATCRPIYGVTTGFGDSARFQVSPEHAGALQRGLITYHLNGTGPATESSTVRATMLIRANSLARGYSGVRREVVELILDFLRHDIVPVIPERGSVGASGDLVPLCYLAEALCGGGEVRWDGRVLPAAEAMEARGLRPVVLQAKEGLALINGTAFMSAFAVHALDAADRIAVAADVCTALAVEGLLGNRGHFHPGIHRQKPHPGQLRSAARIRALLAGSLLCGDRPTVEQPRTDVIHRNTLPLARNIQDPYSIRCMPHVNGVLLDTVDWVERWLTVEINSTNDNPLFDPESAEVHSGGNFYGGHVGHAMDSLKLAVASTGDILDRQVALLVDDKTNHGLPPNLAAPTATGLNHGFKGMQIAASALAAEALKLTNPATAFSRSTEAHNQDKVSMGTIAARDARTVTELVVEIAAITLLAACQAVEYRGTDRLSDRTRTVHELVRTQVPRLDGDRRLDRDLEAVVDMITSGAIGELVHGMHLADLPEESKGSAR
ncbi:histidine ammonia-lyase [Streptomyces clavuligerus]|nr:histidine ammonia-lyase [Streptomyces clavuligerus]